MARLDEEQLEELRGLTVDLVLAIRAEYLRTPQANALKHWDLLGSRMLLAAKTTTSVREWTTRVRRDLAIASAPSPRSSGCSVLLDERVGELRCARQWLDMIEREGGYIVAVARMQAEEQREARKQSAPQGRDSALSVTTAGSDK